MKIIYLDGSDISVVSPINEWVEALGIDFIARKDVPKGVSYKIIDDSYPIPSSIDDYNLITDSGSGGDFGNGSYWQVTEYKVNDSGGIDAVITNLKSNENSILQNIQA